MTNEMTSWSDAHQYDQEAFDDDMWQPRSGVLPRVHLLSMTVDPLGSIAAACRMYEGKGTTSLSDITDEERRHYWKQANATHLKAPLEFVDFHFFIEGVDRAFTHQHVRQRTAVFAQESMRFAVVDDLMHRTTLPPTLYGTEPTMDTGTLPTGREEENRAMWDRTINTISQAYDYLVNNGLPAEEARGLLPHATATRLNYKTNLRNLLDHAGNRLCTQAQFPWRMVFNSIAHAIRHYPSEGLAELGVADLGSNRWQFEELSNIFKPVCYQLGKCPFKASFDRSCTIRDRVEAYAEEGIPSSEWDKGYSHYDPNTADIHDMGKRIEPIHDEEWLLNPAAARKA